MGDTSEMIKPTKKDQETAMESYDALVATIEQLRKNSPEIEIEIEETQDRINIPFAALKLLAEILKGLSKGQAVSVVPVATEMTTQAAADFLGCSRPHLIKLLESGKIPFTKTGRHRRIKFEDINNYKIQMKAKQKATLVEMMKLDEDLNLYDS